jgi:CMP-2-keto-3-deoxyoctulosonic acid synthetase
VFVDDKTKKVVAIDNQDIVNPDNDLGMEVTLTGTVTQSGALHVDKITPAATM